MYGHKGKGKKPKKDGKPVANTSKATRPGPKPGITCFYCKGDGHWKHNCPKYLEDKKAVKFAAKDKHIFDIHVIDVFLASARSNTWLFDSGSVARIYYSHQELQNKRYLGKDEVTMRVGNDLKVEAIAVGTRHLHWP